MLTFKLQYALTTMTIFWLSSRECYCTQDEEAKETTTPLPAYETKIAIVKDSEMDSEMSRGINTSNNYHAGITLASWRWHEVGIYYTVSLFIIVTGLSKVAFHHAKWLSSHVPESCLLIFVGIIVGSIIYAVPPVGDVTGVLPTFTPTLFFIILLPPVILESAYSLYNATFYENLSTILLFAVVGTIFNTFALGLTLHALDRMEWMGNWCPGNNSSEDALPTNITLAETLIFSALISAVDPVAVLAIFQEIGVNKDLYFLIFGESLLNDAITVVLYNTMVALARKPTTDGVDVTMAVLSFFTVNFGGITVGVIFGLFTALITKTTSDVRVVEPLAVLGMAYLSYLTAELFHFSGIISIIFCGLLQAHYSFRNISSKSCVTVKYFIKMVSATSEAVIFLFLGIVLLGYHHDITSGFIYWSILLCLIFRFISTFALTAISNMFRVKKIQLQEQFITAYGGLRGAVGFSLVIMLDEHEARAKSVFVTTTLAVVFFTVFIQGSTIKPLVKLLNIEISKDKDKTLIGEINVQVISHLMAGIEEIIGFRGNFYFKRKLLDIDEKYLQYIFLRDKSENRLRHVFEKSSLNYHYAHLYGPVTLVEDHKTEMLHEDQVTHVRKLSHIPYVEDEPSQRTTSGGVTSDTVGVELRTKGHADVKPGILKKAFQSSPFQRYFQRYNPNMIEDDSQEIENQLEMRRNRAKRITLAIYEPFQASGKWPQRSPSEDTSEESIRSTGRSFLTAQEQQCTYEEKMAVETILQRAQRRRTIAHTGLVSTNIGAKREQETAYGMEMSTLDEVKSHSSGRDALQSTESKAEAPSSPDENETQSPPGASNEREASSQEKPLLVDLNKTDDSDEES